MRVEVSRSGGIAGSHRTWGVQLEQAPNPEELRRLIDACPWDDAGAAGAPAGADRFVYRLTAGTRSASIPEPALAGPWRDLVDRVRDLAAG